MLPKNCLLPLVVVLQSTSSTSRGLFSTTYGSLVLLYLQASFMSNNNAVENLRFKIGAKYWTKMLVLVCEPKSVLMLLVFKLIVNTTSTIKNIVNCCSLASLLLLQLLGLLWKSFGSSVHLILKLGQEVCRLFACHHILMMIFLPFPPYSSLLDYQEQQ